MPPDPPGLDPGFELLICTSCNAGHHPNCRPFRRYGQFWFCECLGVRKARGQLITLPCLPQPKEHPDAR